MNQETKIEVVCNVTRLRYEYFMMPPATVEDVRDTLPIVSKIISDADIGTVSQVVSCKRVFYLWERIVIKSASRYKCDDITY